MQLGCVDECVHMLRSKNWEIKEMPPYRLKARLLTNALKNLGKDEIGQCQIGTTIDQIGKMFGFDLLCLVEEVDPNRRIDEDQARLLRIASRFPSQQPEPMSFKSPFRCCRLTSSSSA